MLTYNSRRFTVATWSGFKDWVQEVARRYGARAWAACLERSESAAQSSGDAAVFHTHAYIMWTDAVGVYLRSAQEKLKYDGVKPRIDRCMAAANGKSERAAALHGLWYVTVAKKGTIETATSFEPWRDYVPMAKWLSSLWEAHKLSHDDYQRMSAQFRTGHSKRKKDIADVKRDEQQRAVRAHVGAVEAELHSARPLKPFRSFAVADRFVAGFESKEWRQPMLVLIGGTNSGKSRLAVEILRKVGVVVQKAEHLEVTVEGAETLDLGSFDVERHAGVLLDGVGDAQILKQNREMLQGRPKSCQGAKSATMMYSYEFTLCHRAVVVTMDLGALNLHLFSVDHWLSDSKNCMVLRLDQAAWEEVGDGSADAVVAETPLQRMMGWSVTELARFLESKDLCGPAGQLYRQGVSGPDFVDFSEESLSSELGISPFTARKLCRVRGSFLQSGE